MPSEAPETRALPFRLALERPVLALFSRTNSTARVEKPQIPPVRQVGRQRSLISQCGRPEGRRDRAQVVQPSHSANDGFVSDADLLASARKHGCSPRSKIGIVNQSSVKVVAGPRFQPVLEIYLRVTAGNLVNARPWADLHRSGATLEDRYPALSCRPRDLNETVRSPGPRRESLLIVWTAESTPSWRLCAYEGRS